MVGKHYNSSRVTRKSAFDVYDWAWLKPASSATVLKISKFWIYHIGL